MHQITALRLSLIAAGFHPTELDDGRLRLDGFGDDIQAHLELDDPYVELDEADYPIPLPDLMAGVALRVSSHVSTDRAKQAKHRIMLKLYESNFWVGNDPPVSDWREVVL